MADAFLAALRVGADGALAAALGFVLLRASALRRIAAPAAVAVAAGLAVGVAAALRAQARGLAPADFLPALQRGDALFALALAALALLARGRSADALAIGWRRPVAEVAGLAIGLLVLAPEGVLLAEHLSDLALLGGAAAPVWGAAFAGLAVAGALGAGAAALWLRAGAARHLTPAAVLSLLLALELAGIGTSAVGAHVLPRLVTAAISRAIHDSVHLLFVVLQVPDHAYLEDWAYQLILRFLEPAVHAAVGAAVVAAPILAAWRAFVRRPAPAIAEGTHAPARRLERARFLRETRLGSIAFAVAAALSIAAIWSARAGSEDLYDPLPEPVVDDGAGKVVVPLGGPLAGQDDRMRKFVYSVPGGRAVTFFTVRRPDGSRAVALDLCEICQPKGYAQLGAGYVFCKYCKTPIPVTTVGQPGGCNPIPVPGAEVSGSTLLVPRDALVSAWTRAMERK
ncbi:Fe-S-containing protein [Anaeromyxobacter oryzisoli]|uniref:Fe-S-containing protein n=1 Tax=Anaeromyxobacter oryzisoli TaxID=2925408 RepID=UPI001F5871C7|nr:Fe-S-containing protein [Anaeromyxobacter sp. SG63]